jgi:hypothetical protein
MRRHRMASIRDRKPGIRVVLSKGIKMSSDHTHQTTWPHFFIPILFVAGIFAIFLLTTPAYKHPQPPADVKTNLPPQQQNPQAAPEEPIDRTELTSVPAADLIEDPKDVQKDSEIALPPSQYPVEYAYRGIKLGQSRAEVLSRLQRLGWRAMKCDVSSCRFESGPENALFPSGMWVRFRRDSLWDLSFEFHPREFYRYVKAVTEVYGPPSRPEHEIGSGAIAVDWDSRPVGPCEAIRLSVLPGSIENFSGIGGTFYLQRLDSEFAYLCAPDAPQ